LRKSNRIKIQIKETKQLKSHIKLLKPLNMQLKKQIRNHKINKRAQTNGEIEKREGLTLL